MFSDVEAPAGEDAIIERQNEEWVRAHLERRIRALPNPVYRLVLKAIDVKRLLGADDFEAADAHRAGGGRAFARPWENAAALVLSRLDAHAGKVWRRFVALCIRTPLDPEDAADSPEVRKASGWLDRNLARARASLGGAA